MTDRNAELAQLIRLELGGKDHVIAKYDEIIWRIRTGYLVITYGVFGLMLGKDVIRPQNVTGTVILVMVGLSVLAFALDYDYEIRKQRVIVARDSLMDAALGGAAGTPPSHDEVGKLLRISGKEQIKLDHRAILLRAAWSMAFYAMTPVVARLYSLLG